MDIKKLLSIKPSQPQIAMFELVSLNQFIKDLNKTIDSGEMSEAYIESEDHLYYTFADGQDRDLFLSECIRTLPVRATTGSAGYDFFSPFSFNLKRGQSITIPTGIRCAIHPNWVLAISPKSGKGTQYRVMMRNTIGWVDSDYYHADNEGHIILKIINDNYDNISLHIDTGASIMQGIFLPYGITINDDVTATRTGGFGSTVQ